MVPVSQLVLPVGVMGLKVNGKTPNPEPGSIIRITAVRFTERQENTRLCFVYKNTVSCDTQTQKKELVQHCMHLSFTFYWGEVHSRQPAKERNKIHDVLQSFAKQSLYHLISACVKQASRWRCNSENNLRGFMNASIHIGKERLFLKIDI